jgi:radical SAM superfamily enzyme YgiQ (UPF0313 family)
MQLETVYHREYALERPQRELPAPITEQLAQRRAMLGQKIASSASAGASGQWLARSYPVLSILAPVMSTHEEKIEFPGDPMCLYSALSYAVDQVVETRAKGLGADAPYNDLCPQWGELPSRAYRASVGDVGVRQYHDSLLNTDQTVFDPRVWNARLKKYFVEVVLPQVQPRVVLISAVSPAHRYAIDIARTVKEQLPGCIVVFGGRHADETCHYNQLTGELEFAPTSPVRKIAEGAIVPVFDFIVAGQGYYALDLLMKAISLAMEIETKTVRVADVAKALATFAPLWPDVRGHALILGLAGNTLHAWPVSGAKLKLAELPSPYKAFAIRARFPVFEREGQVLRTAHFMVTNSCPYHCYFCSEGSVVVGEFLSFKADHVTSAVARVVEYLDYGAEAIFFDDSMFWGGNAGHIINFCKEWIHLREQAKHAQTPTLTLLGREIACDAILKLVWGAQLTVDSIVSRFRPEEGLLVLEKMREAGCTYLYIGIESMAEAVISKVHKNVNAKLPWDQRVRMALGTARFAGIRVGSSVLFGLDGETQATIRETVDKVEELLAEDLLMIASPNILTYHPNTEITRLHEMESQLDYHSVNLDNCPPYSYFEEAFPAVVSRNLTEADIWHIHQQTQERWGTKRNSTPMPPTILEES